MVQDKLNILIVDDEEEIRNLLSEMLNEFLEFPVTILEAQDGQEALAKIRNQKFHLIITDLKMPKLDGQGLFKSLPYIDIQFIPEYILIVSGQLPQSKNKLTVGRVTHLCKPILAKDMQDYLEKIFPHRLKTN